jgi:O-antigen ligase
MCLLSAVVVFAGFPELAPRGLWIVCGVLVWRIWGGAAPSLFLADYAVLGLSVAYVLQLVVARRGNSYSGFVAAFAGMGLYWLLRTARCKPVVHERVLVNLAMGSVLLSCSAIVYSVAWMHDLQRAGFQEFSPMKATLSSVLGGRINEWATLALQGLVFQVACLSPNLRLSKWQNVVGLVGIGLTSAAIWLTFSRGAYVALGAVFGILFGYALLGVRSGSRVILMAAAVVLLSAVVSNSAAHGGVLKTAGLHRTEQQRRSSGSRLGVWSGAVHLAFEHPILGSGPGTFAMRFVPYARLGEYRPFVSRPLNTPLAVFFEEGVLGLAGYTVLLAGLLKCARPSLLANGADAGFKSAMLSSGLLALLVKETVFSSFLEFPAVACLFWVSAATVVNLAEERGGRTGV